MSVTITTSTGTTICTEPSQDGPLVVLDNPAAPDDMRHHFAGRLIDGGFQPAPFSAYALTPEALRGIANLIDAQPARPEVTR